MKYQFVTNKVEGTRRYIPILVYSFGLNSVRKDLEKLQEIYNLPSFYIGYLENGNYAAFCLKTIDYRRCQKIYRQSRCLDLYKSQFEKFRKVYVPLKGQAIHIIKDELKRYDFSAYHAIYLENEYGFKIIELKSDFEKIKPIGLQLSVITTEFENGR